MAKKQTVVDTATANDLIGEEAEVAKTEVTKVKAKPAKAKAAKAAKAAKPAKGKATKAKPAKGKAAKATGNGTARRGRGTGQYTDDAKIKVVGKLQAREGSYLAKVYGLVMSSKTIGEYRAARAKAGLEGGVGGVLGALVKEKAVTITV